MNFPAPLAPRHTSTREPHFFNASKLSRSNGTVSRAVNRSCRGDRAQSDIQDGLFLGFSHGFRPGRDPHQALDSLNVGLQRKLSARRILAIRRRHECGDLRSAEVPVDREVSRLATESGGNFIAIRSLGCEKIIQSLGVE
jgi:hypothetical protein